MHNEAVEKYISSLTYPDDPELFDAAKKAIYLIVQKHGKKNDIIRNVAKKYSVGHKSLKGCVEQAIPESFFSNRVKRAIKRRESTFYKDSSISNISATPKEESTQHIKALKKLLEKSRKDNK